MGCNVSKDVKVEDQSNAGNTTVDGADKSDMSEEKAAETIQASFKGYKTRKALKDNGVLPTKTDGNQPTQNNGEKPGQLPKVIEEEKVEKPSSAPSATLDELADIDLTDVDLEKAAYKIQASYRNFTAKKKQQQDIPSTQPEVIAEKEEPVENGIKESEEENLEDIDLEDPQVEKAALKIQSTFRGYKVRREVKDITSETNGEKCEDEK